MMTMFLLLLLLGYRVITDEDCFSFVVSLIVCRRIWKTNCADSRTSRSMCVFVWHDDDDEDDEDDDDDNE